MRNVSAWVISNVNVPSSVRYGFHRLNKVAGMPGLLRVIGATEIGPDVWQIARALGSRLGAIRAVVLPCGQAQVIRLVVEALAAILAHVVAAARVPVVYHLVSVVDRHVVMRVTADAQGFPGTFELVLELCGIRGIDQPFQSLLLPVFGRAPVTRSIERL